MSGAERRGWGHAAPLLIYVGVLLVYPTLYSARLALTDALDGSFPSLENLRLVARDGLFWRALINNIVLPLAGVAVELVVGTALALLFWLEMPARRLWRTLVIVPFALPEIVYLTAMRYVFAPRGYANGALVAAGLAPVDWLVPGRVATLAVITAVDAWRVTPIVFLILTAALSSIPASLYEAAGLDGAGAWARFRHVTLPLLLPALFAAALLRGLDAVRIFAAPLVLAGVEGAPVLSTYAYHQWSDYGDDGAAAAAALALAFLSVVLAVPLLRWRSSR